MGISLTSLKPGDAGTVLALGTQGPLRQRLLDLGLVPGTPVERLINSPIGDPICYRIRGAMIALRRDDADNVSVAI